MTLPVILMYHQISDLPATLDPYRISVPPSAFEAHMHALHEMGYVAFTLREAARKMRAREDFPPLSVVVTFDDGYLDNYTTAWPILQAVDFVATIFLVAARVGTSAVWDGEHGSQLLLMDWPHIHEMEAAGIEFGSHTHTHAALDTLAADALERELCESKRVLDARLSHPVETLAYPYEQFNAEVIRMAETCGYRAACGTSKMAEGAFNLWRVEIGQAERDVAAFKRKLSGRNKQLAELKRRLRPLKRLIGR